MIFRIVLSAGARQDLWKLRHYIRRASSASIATQFLHDLVLYSEGLNTFPHRGSVRDEAKPGVRVIGFRGRVSIHFEVAEATVTILAYTYAGRNWSDRYDE